VFVAAEQGFDVWAGNNRGTTHSRKHVSWNPDHDPEYWDFSFEELGRFDLKAMIDHALEVSSAQKLSYVGHSQGTTQMFLGLVEDEAWFASRVGLFVALAPVVHMNHKTSIVLEQLAQNSQLLYNTAKAFGFNEVM